jgi:hypothetical protein
MQTSKVDPIAFARDTRLIRAKRGKAADNRAAAALYSPDHAG